MNNGNNGNMDNGNMNNGNNGNMDNGNMNNGNMKNKNNNKGKEIRTTEKSDCNNKKSNPKIYQISK